MYVYIDGHLTFTTTLGKSFTHLYMSSIWSAVI